MTDDIVADVRRACSNLALLAPFSYPIITMPVILDSKLQTYAATNGITLFINPEKWFSLNFKQKLFVLMHNWLHVTFRHCIKIKDRDRLIYQSATDFANNSIIYDMSSNFEPVNGTLYDYAGCSSDRYYKIMYDHITELIELKQTPFCGLCGVKFGPNDNYVTDGPRCEYCGRDCSDKKLPQVIPLEWEENLILSKMLKYTPNNVGGKDVIDTPSDEESKKSDDKMVSDIIKATERSKKMKGKILPSFYEDLLEDIKKTNIPWNRLLMKYCKEFLNVGSVRNPYKPDAKYLPFDVLIPKEESKEANSVVIILDTSYSMNIKEFKLVAGHIQKLSTLVNKCIIIMADSDVKKVFRIKNIKKEIENKKFYIRGRGGTDMKKAFEAADKFRPNLIILFSDMEIPTFPPKPKANVIFLATENAELDNVPYGTLIKVLP